MGTEKESGTGGEKEKCRKKIKGKIRNIGLGRNPNLTLDNDALLHP